MTPVGLEELVGEPKLEYKGMGEGLGSGRYVGLGRDGLSAQCGPGKWPSTWDRGRGKWPVIQDKPGWHWKLERV